MCQFLIRLTGIFHIQARSEVSMNQKWILKIRILLSPGLEKYLLQIRGTNISKDIRRIITAAFSRLFQEKRNCLPEFWNWKPDRFTVKQICVLIPARQKREKIDKRYTGCAVISKAVQSIYVILSRPKEGAPGRLLCLFSYIWTVSELLFNSDFPHKKRNLYGAVERFMNAVSGCIHHFPVLISKRKVIKGGYCFSVSISAADCIYGEKQPSISKINSIIGYMRYIFLYM